jgi:hypothetical protein
MAHNRSKSTGLPNPAAIRGLWCVCSFTMTKCRASLSFGPSTLDLRPSFSFGRRLFPLHLSCSSSCYNLIPGATFAFPLLCQWSPIEFIVALFTLAVGVKFTLLSTLDVFPSPFTVDLHVALRRNLRIDHPRTRCIKRVEFKVEHVHNLWPSFELISPTECRQVCLPYLLDTLFLSHSPFASFHCPSWLFNSIFNSLSLRIEWHLMFHFNRPQSLFTVAKQLPLHSYRTAELPCNQI